jgi:hypothetical protein
MAVFPKRTTVVFVTDQTTHPYIHRSSHLGGEVTTVDGWGRVEHAKITAEFSKLVQKRGVNFGRRAGKLFFLKDLLRFRALGAGEICKSEGEHFRSLFCTNLTERKKHGRWSRKGGKVLCVVL